MDDISKKVLIEVDLASHAAQEGLQALKIDVDALKTSVVANKAAIVDAKAATAQLTTELTKGKVEQQNVKTAIDKARLAQIEANKATKEAKQNMVAAKGSYDEAQKSLTVLGRAIKSAEGGFKSTNPEIQAQIQKYKQLNSELGAFDKKLGNHQRNVGNYEGALKGLSSQLSRLIPGFEQFSSILQGASQNFSAMGNGAGAAEEGLEGAAGAAGGLGAALLAVAAAIAVEVGYLLQFETYSDRASKSMAGLKAATMSFLNQVNSPGGWAAASLAVVTYGGSLLYMAKDAKKAYDQAYEAQGKILELNRQVLISGALSEEENAKIRKDMLIIRNIKSDEATVEKAYQEALKLTNQQYDRNINNQNNLHKAIVDKAIASFKLNKEEVAGLKDVEHGYANILKLAHELTATDKLQASALEDLIASAHKGIEIQATQEVKAQMIQNREDQKQAKLAKQREKGEAEAAKAANDLLEAKRAAEEIVNEKRTALTKMLQDEMEVFGRELSVTDEHYRQLIFKQRDFILKQEQLRNKTKSPAAKAQYTKNISSAHDLIGTYHQGNAADIQKQITDYYKKTAEAVQKGQDELNNIEISAIKNSTMREVAALDQRQAVEQQAYLKEQNLLSDSISRLKNEIRGAHGAEKQALQDQYDQLLTIQGINQDKSLQSEKNYEHQRLEIIRQSIEHEKQLLDEVVVLQAMVKGHGGGNEKGILEAEKTALKDKYEADIKNESLTLAQRTLLHQQYLDGIAALDDNYRNNQIGKILKWTSLVQNAATNIIKQELDHQAQAQELNLSRQKTFELSNQSLTNTQKTIIDEKYRVKEGQLKVKQFKADQKLKIATAVMDGAKAIVADLTLPAKIPFDIATTAIEIAVIASQKPPAYALGGVHYDSDGKGGVLPGYSKKDNMNARLRSGEGIVVSEAMRVPWARQIVSDINQSYGGRSFGSTVPINPWFTPGFASGGVFNNYLPTADNGLRPQMSSSTGRLHPDDIGSIVNGMASAVSNLPPGQIDVKDINYQQGRLSNVYDRLTY